MLITRSDILATESFLREILASNVPAGLVVVGKSSAHRQAVIDMLAKT